MKRDIEKWSSDGKKLLSDNWTKDMSIPELLDIYEKIQTAQENDTVLETISYIFNFGVCVGASIVK